MSQKIIKKLQKRYDEAVERRILKEIQDKPLQDRIKTIFGAKKFIQMDFWCDDCKRDCSGTGYRQVYTQRLKAPTAWYTGFCPYNHKMIRRITDKLSDPYYELSYMVRRQRYDLADDMMTPDNPLFKDRYPDQWKELYGKKGTNNKI